MIRRSLLLLGVAAIVTGWHRGNDVAFALEQINVRTFRAHLQFLAHDLLEGRAPGTRGADVAATYIAGRLAASGLHPVRGSHSQSVPLVGVAPTSTSVDMDVGDAERAPAPDPLPDDMVVWAGRPDTSIAVAGELVFVGYGVHAPVYDWDDCKGLDLSGKVLLVLVGDPPAPPEADERPRWIEDRRPDATAAWR